MKVIHKRILFGLLLTVIVAGVVGGLRLSNYLEHRITNWIATGLSERLGAAASVRSVKVDLLARQIRLYGLRLDQPAGIEEGRLLYIPELEGSLALLPLLSGEIRLREIKLADAQLHILTDTNSVWNLKLLADHVKSGGPKEDPGGFFKELRIEKISAVDCTIHYFELTKDNGEVRFSVSDLTAEAEGIRYRRKQPELSRDSGTLYITARVRKLPLPDARFGLAVRFGTFAHNISTPINASLRLIGFELAILEPVLMKNSAAILGGDAADIEADLRSRPAGLDGQFRLQTIAGHRYLATLSGTLEEPSVQMQDSALQLVLNRSGGVLGTVYGKMRSAASQTIRQGVGTVSDVASGIGESVRSFGGGVMDTARGLVTLNASGISEGLTGMGTALTGGTKEAVSTAGGGVMKGVGDVTGHLTGDTAARQWREDISTRWELAWEDARNRVKLKSDNKQGYTP